MTTLRRKLLGLALFALLCLLPVVFASTMTVGANEAQATTITISSINVQAAIVPISLRVFPDGSVTWDTTSLTSEVGFLEGLSWFGSGGNVVLGGHSELENRVPSVFYRLDEVSAGDEILIKEPHKEWRYVITQVYDVDDTDLSVLYPSDTERLTILTCDRSSLSENRYNRRVVVIAQPFSEWVQSTVVNRAAGKAAGHLVE